MKRSRSVQTKKIISRPLEMVLRVFGIWPNVSYGPICKVLWLIVTITMTTLQIMFLMLRARFVNLIVFMYAFAATLAMSMKVIKLIIIWSNQR